MAISIEQRTKEKVQEKRIGFPIWAIWSLILIIISAAIIYFLFIKKPSEQEIFSYETRGEALTKEEFDKFQEIIEKVQAPPLNSLEQTIPKSFLYSPPKSKTGNQFPFK